MKKIAIWLAIISFTVFLFAWGSMGLKIFDNDYNITVEAYVGLISIIVCLGSIIYLRGRCPHCGKLRVSFGKYCPYCGKEIN